MNQIRKRISLKTLSTARQELIICMHEKQFGTITNLPVVDGEPILAEAKIVRRRCLNRQLASRPTSKNFILKAAHRELLDSLDEIDEGTIDRITFRDGLPCEMEQSSF